DGSPITITQFMVAGDTDTYAAGSTAVIAGVGSLTINANGSYSFVPAAEYNGAVPLVTYTVSDTVNTDTSTLDLSVNPVNDVPDVTDDARSVTEDASPITLSVNGAVTINDSDVGESSFNTASLAFTGRTNNGVTGPNTQLGSLNLNTDGSYSFSVANADVQYLGLGDTIVQTFTVDSADGSATSTITITINGSNDSPTLVVDNVAIANVVGSYSGSLSYTPGVDEGDDQGFTDTFSATNALTWTNITSGFTFIYNPVTLTGTATSDGTGDTFFTVLLKPDGSYDFNLVTPEPITTATIPSLLTGIIGGSGLPSYTFPSSNFGGQFDLVVTGYTNNGATSGTLTISSTDLGVNDNVVHGNKDDLLRFDVQQTPGNTDASVAALTIHVSKTGGWKQTDTAEYKVFYTDGSNSGLQTEQWGSDQQITINMDIAKTVDYVELGAQGTYSFKIDGVAMDYTVNNYPDDYQLDFSLTGSDGDAITDTDTFSVAVNTTDTAAYHITGTSETDTVYGTSGDDTLSGNSDLVVDTFAWQLNEEGTPGSPAIDTVTDFNPAAVADGGDALNIADLLDGENSVNLSGYLYVEKDGGDTVVHIKHDGGLAGDQANADQIITLTGVDLVTGFADQDAIIQNLLTNGKLITD
uniref:type I secretion C-terminal target domain-containing protein n=2 Tax=Zhongshania sp. TaxID=1971902 RepID=UPI00356AE9DF